MEKIQLLIKHAKVFNSYLKKFIDADVSVKDGKFYYIDRKHENLFDAEQTIDADGQYMIPGMVDIHMHIESSMTTPGSFGTVQRKMVLPQWFPNHMRWQMSKGFAESLR